MFCEALFDEFAHFCKKTKKNEKEEEEEEEEDKKRNRLAIMIKV